jgi:hypothetical protein
VDHAGGATLGVAGMLVGGMPGLLTEHPRRVTGLGGSQVQRLEHSICTGTKWHTYAYEFTVIETYKTQVNP